MGFRWANNVQTNGLGHMQGKTNRATEAGMTEEGERAVASGSSDRRRLRDTASGNIGGDVASPHARKIR